MPIPSGATFCDNNRFMQDQTRNQPDHPGERWVSVEELVGHLGVARDTVYRWIDQKGLPAHRLGKLWKFKVSEVDDWVRSGGADEPRSGKPPAGKARRSRR
jgi:excisionase family DNA binding protein